VPRNRRVYILDRLQRLTGRAPPALWPLLGFCALLAMGITMLFPGQYHDGAAGRTVCGIAAVGAASSVWYLGRQLIMARQRRRRG